MKRQLRYGGFGRSECGVATGAVLGSIAKWNALSAIRSEAVPHKRSAKFQARTCNGGSVLGCAA